MATAKKCRHCGEMLDHALRAIEDLKRQPQQQQPMVFMNAGGGASSSSSAAVAAGVGSSVSTKSKAVAILLAIFLGGLGAHKFYLGRPVFGVIYLLLCWTPIPWVIGILEAITYIFTGRQKWAALYP